MTAAPATAPAKTGLLLLNLGTPDEPTTPAVRRYLREFLGDPRVLDINAVGRAALLNLIILPTRPAKSAAAYRLVWDAERGSPLMYHSKDLAAGVATALGGDWEVVLAMRYGKPSIATALAQLSTCSKIVVMPLFPQYASSSTGTAVARVMELAGAAWNVPPLAFVPAFFADAGFLDAVAAVAKPVLDAFEPDHVMFSYHGLPERQILKSDPAQPKQCLTDGCCDRFATPNCYRAQCYATTRALLPRLGLPADRHTTSFQSRLGRTPWIQPFSDHLLDSLPKQRGVKKLAVMCPAFVADCLETLEEIGIRAKEQFVAAGGTDLVLVPSLNATPPWIAAVAAMARRHAGM